MTTLSDDGTILQKFVSLRAVKILIADEDAAFRAHLRQALGRQRRIEIVGEADNAESALTLMSRRTPQVLLIHYSLCRTLANRRVWNQSRFPGALHIMIMLSAPEKTKIIESFCLGAKGIVLKDSAPRVWWRSIGAVLAGQYWLGNESLAILIQAIRESRDGRSAPVRHFGLTPREIEIVQKIADGRSNKEVGQDFAIRERTVKHHLTNIFDKVGVSSRLELALFARDHEIFTAPTPLDFVGTRDPEEVRLRQQRREITAERQGSPTRSEQD